MSQLWQQYQDLKAQNAYLFQYEAADLLHVSEGELLSSAPESVYLGQDFGAIFKRLEAIEEVQLMVRNHIAVHEKHTRITPLKLSPKVGLAIDVGGFDVRLFPSHWHHAFAHDFPSRGKTLRSIQFFDAHGFALQKVYLQSDNDDVWQAIVDHFKQAQKPTFTPATPHITEQTVLNDEQLQTFQQRWRGLTNVHQFFGLLESYALTRQQAFESAPEGYAFQLETTAIEAMYETAAAQEVPLITFIGNKGIVQIQTGTVKNVSRMRGWLNIFDQKHNGFTMHLDDAKIATTWLVLRPTTDGLISCIEALDEQGHTVLSVFGQRVEGQAELSSWRQVLQNVTEQTISEESLA
ncbi:hemin transport protein HemS [Vitreoscilla sp. C1]|uniref:ChuX/HutX family heme-like substrate-binding protein n=1 Tax=Vitreoscilla sp. (strain C1) TaxID=96942 RepID=UPI00148EA299|nr:ChuX/HutX family heme-like substrate-binding protein [Vitreoscilla sp. C1]QJQ52371.1 hemin transport protein HemS [Vitreoscilla sp. C1]